MRSLHLSLSCRPGKSHTHSSIVLIICYILIHVDSDPTPAEQHNSTLPPCMDFLISSGVEKVFRATIQEIHAFEGLRAPLVQHVLRGQKFAHWLNVLLTTTKQIVKQDPEFLNDFERNFRKCLLIWIIKEVQRSMDCNLRQQFAL